MFLRKPEETDPESVGKTANWIQLFLQKGAATARQRSSMGGTLGEKPAGADRKQRKGQAPDPVQAMSPLTVPAGGVYRGPMGQESPAQHHQVAGRPA